MRLPCEAAGILSRPRVREPASLWVALRAVLSNLSWSLQAYRALGTLMGGLTSYATFFFPALQPET